MGSAEQLHMLVNLTLTN